MIGMIIERRWWRKYDRHLKQLRMAAYKKGGRS